MKKLTEGAIVWLPCKIKPGMFPTERYILIDFDGREISGFVPAEDVKEKPKNQVRAVVTNIPENKSAVALLFRGEIFRHTNPVTVKKEWLDKVSVAA